MSELSSPSRHARLLERIKQHVLMEDTLTQIAGVDYPWTRVCEPDNLLLKALTRNDDGAVELDPFWAATWRAAVGLDQFLGRQTLCRWPC
jgi:hypothetical protein